MRFFINKNSSDCIRTVIFICVITTTLIQGTLNLSKIYCFWLKGNCSIFNSDYLLRIREYVSTLILANIISYCNYVEVCYKRVQSIIVIVPLEASNLILSPV